jgi:3-oxosteroid 1-dehydrogenase
LTSPARLSSDVVVVGSGSAALAAALAAAAHGARVVVLEKSRLVGGTSAMSGAGTWVPANHHMLAAGLADSPADALVYLRAVAPPGWEGEEPLWRAFVEAAPAMLRFLEEATPLRFELVHHPDLYVEAPGGRFTGRMLSPRPLPLALAGPFRDRIRPSTLPQTFTYRELVSEHFDAHPLRSLVRLGPRLAWRRLTRRFGMGHALIVGLLRGCLDHGCEILAETRAVRLVVDEGSRVTGVEAETPGGPLTIGARKGVVLATGGFEWDDARLARHFPGGVGLIGSPRTNTGDGQRMAEAVGAKLDRMDQANIYACTVTRYEGHRHGLPMNELFHPHCILVNRDGRRFVNEGDPNVGVELDRRDSATGLPVHLPAWRVFDASYAKANPLSMRAGRSEPGWFRSAPTIRALAPMIDLDPGVLAETVERFNGFVRAGRDADFRRGETEWERFYTGDPRRPGVNGALGAIAAPPFYAAPYHRAILGTKGGARTNDKGQVIRPDGSLIGGLYAAGLAMANPIGTKAAGAGTTIGPCLTWGYICGRNVVRENP